MHIKLKGVRQHKDIELDLPNSGTILLQGASGAGKTTILDAIEDGLYGCGSDIAPWGGTKSTIELTFDNPKIKIIRTRGPHSLTVETESGVFKEDEAQRVINESFGMSEQEFTACSYVKQNSANSLLSYGPADQLKFIESLSFGKSDVDGLKKRIIAKTALIEAEIGIEASSVATKRQMCESIEDSIRKTTPAVVPARSKDGVVNDILKIKNDIASLVSEKDAIDKEIESKNKIVRNSKSYQVVRSFNKDSEAIRADIKGFREKESKCLETLSGLGKPWNLGSKEETQKNIDQLKSARDYIKAKEAIKALATTIYSAYPESKGSNLTQFLSGKAEELQKESEDLSGKKTEASVKLQGLADKKKPQYCPECRAPLGVISGKIVKNSDVPDNIDEIRSDLDLLIKGLSLEAAAKSKNHKEISEWQYEAIRLKRQLESAGVAPESTSIEEVDKKEKRLLGYIGEQWALESQIKNLSSQAEDLKSLLSKKESDLANLIDAYRLVIADKDYIPEEVLTTDIEKLGPLKSAIDAKERGLRLELDNLLKEEKDIDSYNQAIKTAEELRSKVDKINEEIGLTNEKIEKLHRRLAAITRLKQLSDFASVAAIENTILSINASSERFINQMFAEDGTTIRIKNSTTTKSGDERAKLSTEIFHKGKMAKKITSLSGGERSRAYLAFQLGLSELYESPILLIDEGFAGLNLEKKEECLEVLKGVCDKKLVVVVEHGAPESFFDKVIYV